MQPLLFTVLVLAALGTVVAAEDSQHKPAVKDDQKPAVAGAFGGFHHHGHSGKVCAPCRACHCNCRMPGQSANL
ncbi:unnamed protein product [Schistocephalus solidus]|uniref:Uncharacterized protein n=1 Tax=Schistocephalus solidus TaxID=70667 RepID=A0A183T0I2_SCHSO|nr:unnamed protein product [Schistocephalus solidus]